MEIPLTKAKQKEREEEARTLRERAEAIREQRIKEAIRDFPDREAWVEECVEERKRIRVLMIQQLGQEPLTEEEIAEIRSYAWEHYLESFDDKLAYIRRHSEQYKVDLNGIIEELKAEAHK